MLQDQAKELITYKLERDTKYILDKEKDTYGIKSFIMITSGIIPISIPSLVDYPIITSVGIVAVSAALVKSLEYVRSYTKEDKIEMKRNHYGRRILLSYKKQLKKGINPLENVPYNPNALDSVIDKEIDKKMLVKKKAR